jgi:hypothetical protein
MSEPGEYLDIEHRAFWGLPHCKLTLVDPFTHPFKRTDEGLMIEIDPVDFEKSRFNTANHPTKKPKKPTKQKRGKK